MHYKDMNPVQKEISDAISVLIQSKESDVLPLESRKHLIAIMRRAVSEIPSISERIVEAKVRATLEIYADPFDRDDGDKELSVPSEYSDLDFGRFAREALAMEPQETSLLRVHEATLMRAIADMCDMLPVSNGHDIAMILRQKSLEHASGAEV